MKPILSVRDLAARLGISVVAMRALASDVRLHYETFPLIDKTNKNKVRQLTVPTAALKDLQRRVKNNILSKIPLPENAHGGVRNRSPRTNAAAHLNQRCVINLDVKQFFPHVRHYMVYRMFRGELGFGRDVASLLTRLTTLNSELPQGAPTSTAIANLFLAKSFDRPIQDRAARNGSASTRFVDDVTLSGTNPRPLINVVARMLSRKRLPMYRGKAKWDSRPKLRITPNSSRQEVTGLIVNSPKGPSVSRQRRDKIRAAIVCLRNAGIHGPSQSEVNSIRGKIAYVRSFNPGAANRLQRYLETTLAHHA